MTRKSRSNPQHYTSQGEPLLYTSLFFPLLLASSVLYILYSLFYHFSPAIWSFGIKLPVEDYTPWVRWCAAERDGIEAYVLYLFVFLNIGLTLLLDNLFSGLKSRFTAKLFFLAFIVVSILFYKHIGFHPPMAEVGEGFNYAGFMISVSLVTLILSILTEGRPKTAGLLIAALLIPICFISTQELRLGDAGYIFSPALRILGGFKPNETSFQYDYFLSSLAAVWMRLRLPILSFKILGQISYYALFTGIYFFARDYFVHKRHALYLVLSMVLVKIYANMHDPIFLFQITPLRQDLWFIVLVLAYYKGIHNWLVGFTLGLLTVFHHNFGLIYVVSYLVFIALLSLFEMADRKSPLKEILGRYYSLYRKNIVIIAASLVIYKIFFASSITDVALSYQKYGIGFMPIARDSFYWYIPVILSMASVLILRKRNLLSERYFKISVFLIILIIGNSLYFFGRSHEHNIINISSALLLCLFLLFDLLDFELQKKLSLKINKFIIPALSIMVVLGAAHYYSGRAAGRIAEQYNRFQKRQFSARINIPFNVEAVRRLTGSSPKVTFLSEIDFYYYYKGGYVPQDYYGLIFARKFKKETVDFLNAQLAGGYYLLTPKGEYGIFAEIIQDLNFKNIKDDSGFIVISNNHIE